jgi:signal transduction histidine kinase
MSDFAHPDAAAMVPADLNRAIASTLTIAQGEYKHVADVVTDFRELPLVTCHVGAFNQALLNIVVNAAHAIADTVSGTARRGTITVTTRLAGDTVVVSVADTGGGIPEAVRERIFDPFFTTKEVGRGTGQGLPVARAVIAEKHQGSVRFETELGKGTTFFISLPIRGRDAGAQAKTSAAA